MLLVLRLTWLWADVEGRKRTVATGTGLTVTSDEGAGAWLVFRLATASILAAALATPSPVFPPSRSRRREKRATVEVASAVPVAGSLGTQEVMSGLSSTPEDGPRPISRESRLAME